jgi:hypothetical protein
MLGGVCASGQRVMVVGRFPGKCEVHVLHMSPSPLEF